jgi:DNA helicase-2/ATP-dependent DNA helicase PcrA
MEIHEQDGPILLLAGPGTGKTYRIAQRIKYLCETQAIPRENVAVITFTAAAARNMHERISDSSKPNIYTHPNLQPKLICTMHSLGFKIIGENSEFLGYDESIKVLSSDSARSTLIGDATQLSGFNREESTDTVLCRQYGNCQQSEEPKCIICHKYRELLHACSAIDYDDQILLANHVLKNKPEVLADYKQKCKHLLIDEYQDINAGQFELISLLIEDQENGLFAVGDDDQSIYSWRGGTPKYIRRFKRYFAGNAKIVPLLKSYRCPKYILESALAVVEAHDKNRLEKGEFEYENKSDGTIKVHNVASDRKEAILIKSIIKKSLPSKKVLVLIPRRPFGHILIDLLKQSNINFYAPLNNPGEGLPVIKLLSSWIQNTQDSISLRQIISNLIDNKEFGVPSNRARKKETLELREESLRLISDLWDDVLNNKANNLWDSLERNVKKGELLEKLYKTLYKLIESYQNQDNIQDFMSNLLKSLNLWKSNKDFLDEIVAWIDLTKYLSSQTTEPGVEIMTLQGAKGLEADVVCIIGMENGILPRDVESVDRLPEESRLMLVSMTRAKEELHIIHARTRSGSVMYTQTFKGGRPSIKKSIFIDSIPDDYLDNQYHK